MPAKSYYDLDHLIDLNERRLAQNMSEYDKSLGRFTNILVVYSGVTIFLVPTIQDLLSSKISSLFFIIPFCLFAGLFLLSVYFTVRLLLPVELAYLVDPRTYYTDYREQYESAQPGAANAEVDKLIKASYIDELETAVASYDWAVREKRSFYANALRWGLLSILPYFVCLGFHFGIRDETIHKVQIVAPAKVLP